MIRFFVFPELFEPEDCLHPTTLKTPADSQPSDPGPLSPGDIYVANAGFGEGWEPLARVLKKYPELRDPLYKALDAEGAFNFFPKK